MSGKNSCKNCGSFDLEVDPSRGDTICTVCGTVLEDSVIVSEVQFEENAHGGSSAIGQFVSSDSKGGGSLSIMGSFSHGIQKESREITIQKAKSELSRMCQQLRINQHCLETALTFYKMALTRHLTKGRRSSLVCAACLYIACRLEKTPHLLIDFSDVLQVDPFTLGRTFTSICQDLCITLPLVDPCLYILRYANQMDLGEKTHEVSTTALRVLKRMKRDSLHCGRRPSGLCGSALIIAARFHNIRKKLKDIVNIVHIQEVTLRKRLLEFGDTPSSSLTTDEFLTVDLGEEQDPPSFKAARMKDKERLQKYTDVEYEMKMQKLQRLIDKELEKKRTKGRRFSICSVDTTSTDNNDDAQSTTSGILKDSLDDLLDDEGGEVSEAVVKTTLESIDNVCSSLKKNTTLAENEKAASPKGLGPTLETIGISGEETEPAQPAADPEPKPAESTEKTDQFEIEHSLDDLDDDELDSYIVTDDEFQQKKKAWMELYAAFLEEQKKKEEEKLLKEKEDGKGDKKRKRQKRTKGAGAATAGEAVEKVLREKKISNKLNYDVLKSLNMNDFVKSMNFGAPGTMKEIESKAKDGRSSDDVPSKVPRLGEALAASADPGNEDEDDMDDDYDDDEPEPESNVRSISEILRSQHGQDDDDNYDDDY
ncbi:transcription factor IIIB 90 kDa subunit [Planococcus citri]|uniref:transcription factor IIIB 90 kDa subunit n=1 Tax=Planococcus citri TaxID=170843 RepID=UPI0031F9AED9